MVKSAKIAPKTTENGYILFKFLSPVFFVVLKIVVSRETMLIFFNVPRETLTCIDKIFINVVYDAQVVMTLN